MLDDLYLVQPQKKLQSIQNLNVAIMVKQLGLGILHGKLVFY